MKLIVREENYVHTLNFNSFQLDEFDGRYEIWMNNLSILFKRFTDPFIAEYVFNLICEYINTDKIFYLKTEEEYKAELKEFEKIFKE